MCILSVYTMPKVVGYYGLRVMSMSVMGFQKKSLDGQVGGWCELYTSFFLDFLNFFNFANPLTLWTSSASKDIAWTCLVNLTASFRNRSLSSVRRSHDVLDSRRLSSISVSRAIRRCLSCTQRAALSKYIP